MFNPEEMQVCVFCSQLFFVDDRCAQTVISGKNCGDWTVEDLAAHAKFEGCSSSSSTVVKLMKVLREFSPQQRSLFLKFVTSCPRPPLLGFSELQVETLFFLVQLYPLMTPSPRMPVKRAAPALHLPYSKRARLFFFRRRRPLAICVNVLQPSEAAAL